MSTRPRSPREAKKTRGPAPRRAEPRPSGEPRSRKALKVGAGSALAGIALVGVDLGEGARDLGALLCLVGVFALIYGIHTFGRLGPDHDGAASGPKPRPPAEA